MQIPFVDGSAMAERLDFRPLVEALRAGHRGPPPAVERVLMQQPGATGGEDAFLVWPAWQPGRALGLKAVTVFPDNPAAGSGLPSVQGLYLLFDGGNGRPRAVLDGTEMTYWKTAADSGLAADYLARADARTLLMVGAGALAPFLVRAHRTVRPGLTRVLVWNRTAAKAETLAAAWDGDDDFRPEPTRDLEAAARAADIVCCATASERPLIRGDWLKPGAHVDLVGGYTPAMREADDTAVRRARLFVDSRWFTLVQCGDLAQPIAAGVVTPAQIEADLFELCRGDRPGRGRDDEITLFKSGGGAHLDLMTAEHVAALFGY